MRKQRTIAVPAKTSTVEDAFCDLCGAEILSRHEQGHDFAEVDLALRKGDQYPEGTNCTETTFDVCPACFEAKVIPALVAIGLTPVERDRDW
jgi:hypothetical protein